MPNRDIGCYQHPGNSNGIVRARTTGQLRSWELPRTQKALEKIHKEFHETEFPSIYILLEAENKVYVGEAKNIYKRLRTHMQNPEQKIKGWSKVLILNDGRPATQSDFNDTAVRKALELYVIKLLKANRYRVVSQGEYQRLNDIQQSCVTSLMSEINVLLRAKTIITKFLEEHGHEEVFIDELAKILEKDGRKIKHLGKYEAMIDDEKAFIRPGSKKPSGWQITFRGRKPDSFIDSLQKGKGYLLVSRNGVLLIPLKEVQKAIQDKSAFEQDTIDIWIVFKENQVTLRYKKNVLDVTKYRIINF